jgi:transcriptional regulator with GAF, ATPase, and Fis domain
VFGFAVVRGKGLLGVASGMDDLPRNGHVLSSGQEYRTLLAVAEAIVSHRDLHALFHDLTGRLLQVVRFDYLILVLHDAANNTMRRHILETSDPSPIQTRAALPVDEGPAGWVWQTQQPLIISNVAEEARWPRFQEYVKQRINSLCLPLGGGEGRVRGGAPADSPAGAAVTLADAEREHILRALRSAHWVLRGPHGAAARLGMKRSTLQWKMKKLGISRPE